MMKRRLLSMPMAGTSANHRPTLTERMINRFRHAL
jgi:hypothetical protein